MTFNTINSNSIFDVWRYYVWKDQPLFGIDLQQYLGGKDNSIRQYNAEYFAIKDQKNIIRLACGGHKTSKVLYRLRGFFFDPEITNISKNIKIFIDNIGQIAKQNGSKIIWWVDQNEPFNNEILQNCANEITKINNITYYKLNLI